MCNEKGKNYAKSDKSHNFYKEQSHNRQHDKHGPLETSEVGADP